jgi:hypothetical protein
MLKLFRVEFQGERLERKVNAFNNIFSKFLHYNLNIFTNLWSSHSPHRKLSQQPPQGVKLMDELISITLMSLLRIRTPNIFGWDMYAGRIVCGSWRLITVSRLVTPSDNTVYFYFIHQLLSLQVAYDHAWHIQQAALWDDNVCLPMLGQDFDTLC